MPDSASRLHRRRVRQLPRPAAAQARQAHHMLPLLLLEGSCRAVPRLRRCHGRRDPSATCGRASRDGAVRGRQPVEALSRVAPACSPTYRGRQKTRFALTRLVSSSYRNRRAMLVVCARPTRSIMGLLARLACLDDTGHWLPPAAARTLSCRRRQAAKRLCSDGSPRQRRSARDTLCDVDRCPSL